MTEVGLKINANKSHFVKAEIKYLGYWITQQGIQPLPKKVEALQNLAPPKNKKELHQFILGMINYYCDMWMRQSEMHTP
jgi:hypothetical protein